MRSANSYTLAEIMAVVFIIAVLSMIALPLYVKAVEKNYNKQALAMIQILLAGEQMYLVETGSFVSCAGSNACTGILRVDIPAGKWNYSVSAAGDSGVIQAQRASAGGRRWQLNFNATTPVDTLPVCSPGGPYCK